MEKLLNAKAWSPIADKLPRTVFILKLWIYEIHIFELRNEELNVKKILAVINATYAVAKR